MVCLDVGAYGLGRCGLASCMCDLASCRYVWSGYLCMWSG